MIDKVKQGKRNRINGAIFEKRVRLDLESKGWIVSKWQNNVDLNINTNQDRNKEFDIGNGVKAKTLVYYPPKYGKCVPAKMGRFRTNQSGFPDFIAYKHLRSIDEENDLIEHPAPFGEPSQDAYVIIFIECKSNGYLDKEEKEKARWYLNKTYCSKFLIASKVKFGRKVGVKYTDFKNE